MTWIAQTLEGELVRLEPMSPEHEDGLWEASRDPRTWQWLSVAQPQTREEMHAYLDAALANAAAGIELPLVTVRREDGRVIGSTRYLALRPARPEPRDRLDVAHPGCLGHGRERRGEAADARARVRAARLPRVELKTDARNERSRGAMAALPAQFEGVHRKHMLVRGGERRDSAWYSVLDDEWPAVRANLLRRLGR